MIEQLIAATTLFNRIGAKATALVGSTYALGQGKDLDVLILTDDMDRFCNELAFEDFTLEGNAYAADGFRSMRKGDVNALVTQDRGFFDRTVLAAEVTKVLRVQTREDRIKVYRVIREGKKAEEL
jgi:hypothetical protein